MKSLEEQYNDFVAIAHQYCLDTKFARGHDINNISFLYNNTHIAWMFYTHGYWNGISEGKL